MGDSRGSSRLAGVAACFAAAVWLTVLTGCAAATERPAVLPPASASTASDVSEEPTTDEPTATLTTEPTTKRQRVEAAVHEYYAAMDEAIRTGDTARLRSATTAACTCRQMIGSIEALFESFSTDGAGVALETLEISRVRAPAAVAEAVVRSRGYSKVRADGVVAERFPEGTDRALLTLHRGDDGSWRVREVLYLSREVR